MAKRRMVTTKIIASGTDCNQVVMLKTPVAVRDQPLLPAIFSMLLLLQELVTDNCPFVDLPEKRRTLYSLTRDEMQECRWLKPLLVA